MRFFRILVLLLLMPVHSQGQEFVYQPGEKVQYSITYGGVQAGVASLELKPEIYNGKEVWHSVFTGKTVGLAEALFRLLDVYESYIEPESELPVFSVRNIQEGRYRKYNEVAFDHYSRPDSAVLTSDITGIHVTQKGIHDIVSCFYYLRNHHLPNYQNLKKGDMITIMTWFTDELYPITLKYIGVDEVKTRLGKIKCLRFNPVTEVGRLFKTQEDMTFWFSADKNFVPVKGRFDIFVGSFSAEIIKYEGLKYPLEIKKKETDKPKE
jgi:hypothetical protein